MGGGGHGLYSFLYLRFYESLQALYCCFQALGHSQEFQILVHRCWTAFMLEKPEYLSNSPGILSRPGALPSFSFLTALSPSDLSGGVQVVVLTGCPV